MLSKVLFVVVLHELVIDTTAISKEAILKT